MQRYHLVVTESDHSDTKICHVNRSASSNKSIFHGLTTLLSASASYPWVFSNLLSQVPVQLNISACIMSDCSMWRVVIPNHWTRLRRIIIWATSTIFMLMWSAVCRMDFRKLWELGNKKSGNATLLSQHLFFYCHFSDWLSLVENPPLDLF